MDWSHETMAKFINMAQEPLSLYSKVIFIYFLLLLLVLVGVVLFNCVLNAVSGAVQNIPQFLLDY